LIIGQFGGRKREKVREDLTVQSQLKIGKKKGDKVTNAKKGLFDNPRE